MDMYKLNLIQFVSAVFRRPDFDLDYTIDGWIQDALLDDALARPPGGAWERLRQAIVERQMKNYGMWVLDEPQRDPPESPPMLLEGHDFERAMRIYGDHLTIGNDLRRDVIWSSLLPIFSVMVNW